MVDLLRVFQNVCRPHRIPTWKTHHGVCRLTTEYLKKDLVNAIGAALTTLWIFINLEGVQTPKVAQRIFLKQVKKFNLIPKKRKAEKKIKRKGGGGKRRKESTPPAWKGVQVYYDGSGRPEPPVRGVGFAIFKEGVEVTAGAETIPFDTNNVGEFKGALIGLRQASKLTERVEVIGDCMILTNAAANDKNVKEVELDNILDEIKTTAGKMKEAKFTHVFREHNKRADAIATAASLSEKDGRMAIASKDWNPRAQKLGETDEEWIVLNSERWKRINTGSKKKWAFPVPSSHRIRKKGSKVLQSDLAIFPKMNIPERTTASKGVVLYNITRWSKEGPLVSKRGEGEEIIVQRMEELG